MRFHNARRVSLGSSPLGLQFGSTPRGGRGSACFSRSILSFSLNDLGLSILSYLNDRYTTHLLTSTTSSSSSYHPYTLNTSGHAISLTNSSILLSSLTSLWSEKGPWKGLLFSTGTDASLSQSVGHYLANAKTFTYTLSSCFVVDAVLLPLLSLDQSDSTRDQSISLP